MHDAISVKAMQCAGFTLHSSEIGDRSLWVGAMSYRAYCRPKDSANQGSGCRSRFLLAGPEGGLGYAGRDCARRGAGITE